MNISKILLVLVLGVAVMIFFASAFDSDESIIDAFHVSCVTVDTFTLTPHTAILPLPPIQDYDMIPCEELLSFLGQKEKAPPFSPAGTFPF
ncbi:MAG TPA: hypothetical protein P5287_05090 [bacterium]|nr:hypothetical protein [bacterium]